MSLSRLTPLGLIAAIATAATAAPLQNHGFESADLRRVEFLAGDPARGLGPASDLLPAWQLFDGATRAETMGYNYAPLSGRYASLISADEPPLFLPPFEVEGRFALRLVSARNQTWTLIQRGDIPAGVMQLGLRFSQWGFQVSVDGQPLTPLGGGENFYSSEGRLALFDISPFAGRNAELRISTFDSTDPIVQTDLHYLDSVSFVVPEPPPWVLLGCGISLWWIMTRRHGGKAQPTE